MIIVKKQLGFTLVEALLVVTIFAVVLTASFSLSSSQIFEDDVQSKVLQVSELLERARNNSANGYRGDVWGIEVLDSDALCDNSGDCILMFKGDSFSGRDSSYDAFVNFDTNTTGVYIDSDQENEFYFAYQSGFLTSSTNASLGDQYIDFNTNSGDQQSLVITKTGTVSSFVCGEDQVFDVDGNGYNTVGDKYSGIEYCWMAENLNTGTMLAAVTDDPSDNSQIEKWCYSDTSSNCDIYGGLYDWDEAMEYGSTEPAQGICPSGWHMMTSAEFTLLSAIYSATDLKIGGNSGFNLLMGGTKLVSTPDYYDYIDGAGADDKGYLWSSSVSGSDPYYYYIQEDLDTLSSNSTASTNIGNSVRCMKDY